jgi:hypothetical protein
MSPVEDRLHAAARALAEAIPDDNPPPRRRAPGHNGTGPRPARWHQARAWLIPLAAAVAVLIAVAASLAITHGWDSHHATPPAHTPSPQSLPMGVPPYYVAYNPSTWHAVAVSSSATGRTLAVAQLSQTWFPRSVGTGPNDRTFVVWASTRNLHGPGRFYLLRFDPHGDRATLVLLSVHLPDGIRADMMAISPDGKQLAVAYAQNGESITVFNLSTGAVRTWTGGQLAIAPNGFLSWSANSQTVQYCMYSTKAKTMAYGLLNTSAPQTPLPAKAVPVRGYIGGAVISADGTLVVVGTDNVLNADNGTWWLARFAAATGRPLGGQMHLAGDPDSPIAWASPDASLLIMDGIDGKVRGLQVVGVHGPLGVPVGGRHLLGAWAGAGATAW